MVLTKSLKILIFQSKGDKDKEPSKYAFVWIGYQNQIHTSEIERTANIFKKKRRLMFTFKQSINTLNTMEIPYTWALDMICPGSKNVFLK